MWEQELPFGLYHTVTNTGSVAFDYTSKTFVTLRESLGFSNTKLN